ncbi:hypothetical protein KY319_03225 [Candidatus Woesearchaeota archaeon]|nr:hypothetical protein [Candidatus Woesearchaeota archaeon]
MRKVTIFAVLVFLALIGAIFILSGRNSSVGSVVSGNEVVIYEFYGKGCPHCSSLNAFLEELKPKYPSLKVIEKEVYFNKSNIVLFETMSSAFGQEISGVPAIFIDDTVIVGFSPVIKDKIEQEIQRCLAEGCPSPLNRVPKDTLSLVVESSPVEEPGKTRLKEQLTLGAVISAAAVDAINPCAFAVLIILLTTILASDNRKRALLAGLAFSLSIYLSYFLMGLGLYSAISAAGLSHMFYGIVAVLAIFVGLFNLKDYFAYGKWFVMEVPLSWRPKLKCIIKGVTSVPGAFLIGFVVSLFLLPCTSGPYIVILGLLAKTTTKNYALVLLLLYNLIFILPMLLITFAVFYGFTTTEKAEEWRQKKLKILHLIAGIIILLLGAGMLLSMYFGWI